MSLSQSVLLIYIAASIVIALISGKVSSRSKTSVSFLAAGRSLGWAMVCFSIFGSTVGGMQFVGVTANYYTYGLAALLYSLVRAFAYITKGIFIAPKVSRLSTYVCNNFFGSVYNKRDSMLYGILQSFVLLGVAASQIMVGAILLPTIFPGLNGQTTLCIIICALLYGLMASFGGQLAVSSTNVVHTLCILVCAILISCIGIFKTGGMATLINNLPKRDIWFSLSGQSAIVTVGWFLSMGIQAYAGQTEWNVIASAKSPNDAQKGLVANGIAQIALGLIVITIGMLAAANFPNIENPNNVFSIVANWVNPLCGALAVSAVFAASASTAQGMLVAEASVMLNWIRQYGKYKGLELNDKQEYYISRACSALFVVLAAVMSLFAYDIIRFVINVMSVMTPFSLLLLLTLYRPSFMRKSMCTVIFFACIASIGLYFLIPPLQAICEGMIIYVLLASTIICLLLCRAFDKRPIDTSNIYKEAQ